MNPLVIDGAGTDWAAVFGNHGHPVPRLLIDQALAHEILGSGSYVSL